MIPPRRILLALAAAAALTASDSGLTQPGATGGALFVKNQARISDDLPTPMAAAAMPVVAEESKSSRPLANRPCAGHAWPYIPSDCLVSADGSAARPVARFITVEQRTAYGSALVRTPATQLVERF